MPTEAIGHAFAVYTILFARYRRLVWVVVGEDAGGRFLAAGASEDEARRVACERAESRPARARKAR